MQISNNYQNNTSFTAFRLPQSCHKRFMGTLRTGHTTNDLFNTLHILEKEAKNTNDIYLEDLGYLAGHKMKGHLYGFVNGNDYWNSEKLFVLDTFPKFMKKLSSKAQPKLSKAEKLEVKAQEMLNKADIARAKDFRKRGLVTEGEQRQYLLGEIYKLITKHQI